MITSTAANLVSAKVLSGKLGHFSFVEGCFAVHFCSSKKVQHNCIIHVPAAILAAERTDTHMKVCEQRTDERETFMRQKQQVYPFPLPLPDPPTGKMSGKKGREIANADISLPLSTLRIFFTMTSSQSNLAFHIRNGQRPYEI